MSITQMYIPIILRVKDIASPTNLLIALFVHMLVVGG